MKRIETTSEMSGYPRNLKFAYIDFEDMKEAEDFAKEYGGEVEYLHRRFGQKLWYRTGHLAYEPYRMDETMVVGGCYVWDCHEENRFFDVARSFIMDGMFEDPDDLCELASDIKEIYEMITTLGEDQRLIQTENWEYEIVDKQTMKYSYDSTEYAIGVVMYNNKN